MGARASLHRLRDVAGAGRAAGLFCRTHAAAAARHRGHRAAVARPDPGCRADRAARHSVRRALPVRFRPRRGERRIRRVPHPDGGSPPALCRGRAADQNGARRARIRVAGRILPDPAHRESAEIMAKLGFGILVVMQNEWAKAAESIVRYREIAHSVGHHPPPPIVLTNVCCAESRAQAHARAMEWLGRKWESIDAHYRFSDGHLAAVKGYESYGKMAKTYARLQDAQERVKATEFYVKIQIVGTPDDCLQQIAELQRVTGLDHLVTEFSFGGLPHEEAEQNMRLFAERVLPRLRQDPAFAAPAPAAPSSGQQADLFAPA